MSDAAPSSPPSRRPQFGSPAMRLHHAADAVLLQFVDDPGEYSDFERAQVLERLRIAVRDYAASPSPGERT